VVMGLIFAEMCLFLMHAFHLLDGGEEGRVARVSYFKRGALIFIGLFFLMIFYLVGLLSIDAIILFASSTYVMSLVLSRNSFYSWGKIVPN
ncbi:hypothetical protein C1X40_33985, partial [Pseudomonas sp. GW456-11-11-14-TSB2]|uniref:hypothetical protein n=1 Tax=Pseudomonas sp. GW456-11-11-14-TSB2 TaxID=2751348 RepID=UPI000CB7EE52